MFRSAIKRTLSGKLTLLFVLMTILLVILSALLIGSRFKDNFQTHLRPHLNKYLEYVLQDLGNPPDKTRAEKIARELSLDIQYTSDTETWNTNTYGLGTISLAEVEFHHHRHQQSPYRFGSYQHHEILVSKKQDYTLLFILKQPGRHLDLNVIVHFAVLLIVLVLFYHATRRIFSPINSIKNGVQRFGEGELDYRLDIKRQDELGELSIYINNMADDIQSMLDAKRQLLLAISHELRTPLTRIRVATAMMQDKSHQSSIETDVLEMEKLIEGILESERLNTRHAVVNKTEFDLVEIVQSSTKSFKKEAVKTELPDPPLIMKADKTRIELLLHNLLENAVRHTPKNAEAVMLKVEKCESEIKIIISDHGDGIEAEHLPHITEAFYRADASRQRNTGTFGLGLYLCKAIAEAHDGSLIIESSINKGTTATVKLPI